MTTLYRNGEPVASVCIANSWFERLRGLLPFSSFSGALLIRRTRSIHTLGMRFPIDVAFCDGELRVLCTRTVVPMRVTRPVWRAKQVVEAEAGAFRRWNLTAGDVLSVVP